MVAARIRAEVDRLRADAEFADLSAAVAEHRIDPYDAAQRLLDAVYGGTGTPTD